MLTNDDRQEIERIVERELLKEFTFELPVEAIMRVVARATEVFGAQEKAVRWLRTPVRALGDRPPIALLNNPEEIARVEDVLGRVEHGLW